MSTPETTPFLLVLAGPSGAGKSSVLRPVVDADPRLEFSVSCTTRPRREFEREGVDYYFLEREDFERARDGGEFAEWAPVHDHLYGTRAADLEATLQRTRIPALDIDIQGAAQIVGHFPGRVVSVFLFPPNLRELESRLRARGSEDEAALARRMENARGELRAADRYDYWIVNDELAAAQATLRAIIAAESARRERWTGWPPGQE